MSSDEEEEEADVFMECYYCSGKRGCPRASPGSIRCSADKCKKKQAADNKAAKAGLTDTLPLAGNLMESASLPRSAYPPSAIRGRAQAKGPRSIVTCRRPYMMYFAYTTPMPRASRRSAAYLRIAGTLRTPRPRSLC